MVKKCDHKMAKNVITNMAKSARKLSLRAYSVQLLKKKRSSKLLAMNASGNRVVTDKTNTAVSTYVFCQPAKSVEQYEEIFKQLNSNECGQECGYQFVMCRAEVDESGQVKVLGMVQFEKEPFLIDEIVQYKNALKRLLDANSETQFFREIQDCNVNNTFLRLKYEGTGQIFMHGVFVANWSVEDHVWTSEDEENDQDDMYVEHHLYF